MNLQWTKVHDRYTYIGDCKHVSAAHLHNLCDYEPARAYDNLTVSARNLQVFLRDTNEFGERSWVLLTDILHQIFDTKRLMPLKVVRPLRPFSGFSPTSLETVTETKKNSDASVQSARLLAVVHVHSKSSRFQGEAKPNHPQPSSPFKLSTKDPGVVSQTRLNHTKTFFVLPAANDSLTFQDRESSCVLDSSFLTHMANLTPPTSPDERLKPSASADTSVTACVSLYLD